MAKKNQNVKNEVELTPSIVETSVEETVIENQVVETVIENEIVETVIEKPTPMTKEELEAFTLAVQKDFKGVNITRKLVEDLEKHPEVQRIIATPYDELNFVETTLIAFVRRMRINFNSKIDHRMTAHIESIVEEYNKFADEKGVEKLTKEDFKYLRNNVELKAWLELKEDKKKGTGAGPKSTEEINKYSREYKMAKRVKELGFLNEKGEPDIELYKLCKTQNLTAEEFKASGYTKQDLLLIPVAQASNLTLEELKARIAGTKI